MGGRLRKISFRCRRHTVFLRARATDNVAILAKGRMSTRLPGARFCAHADPDSVWTSFRSPPPPPPRVELRRTR